LSSGNVVSSRTTAPGADLPHDVPDPPGNREDGGPAERHQQAQEEDVPGRDFLARQIPQPHRERGWQEQTKQDRLHGDHDEQEKQQFSLLQVVADEVPGGDVEVQPLVLPLRGSPVGSDVVEETLV